MKWCQRICQTNLVPRFLQYVVWKLSRTQETISKLFVSSPSLPLSFLSPPLLPLSSSPSSLLLPFLSPPLPFFLSFLQPSPVAPGGSGGTSGPPTSGQPSFKLSVPESLDRVKEEFSYLQAQTTKWVKVFVIKFEYNALLMRVKGVLLMW